MRRLVFATLMLAILLFWLSLALVRAATFAAASCSQADVGDAVALATHGDTVTIPAGSCTWSTGLSITVGIHLQGAGEASTILTDDTGVDTMIACDADPPNQCEVSGLEMTGTGSAGSFPRAHLKFTGTQTEAKAHDLTCTSHTKPCVAFANAARGVVWNLTSTGGVVGAHVYVDHRNWGGGTFGDGSWAAAIDPGGADMVYVEDSSFDCTSLSPTIGNVTDALNGARLVFRHNTLTGCNLTSHGTDSGGRQRSVRWFAAYENEFTFVDPVAFLFWCRGGSCLFANNTINASSDVNNVAQLTNCRDAGAGCGGSGDDGNAFPPWDTAGGDGCEGSGTYDQNQVGETGYRCVDQPGSGTSNDLAGNDPPTAGWVGNALEAIYLWGNSFTGTTTSCGFGTPSGPNCVSSTTHVQSGRDYFNDGTARPGWTAFAYPHPLRNADCTHYASPAGGGDGLSQGAPFQVADFWPVASAGDTLCLLDGTYTGVNSMVTPPGTLTGTAGNPITIRALNAGEALINGEGARDVVEFNAGNDWFVVEDLNACCNDTDGRVVFVNQADNVTIRRIVAWDTDSASNTHVFGSNTAAQVLFEDNAGFGTGRKIFEAFTSDGVTFRRNFGIWMGSTNTSPKETFHYNYNSLNITAENNIGLYNRTETVEGANHVAIHRIARNDNNVDQNIRLYGTIGLVRSGDTFDPNQVISMSEGSPAVRNVQWHDTVIAIAGHAAVGTITTGAVAASSLWEMHDATLIGAGGSSIDPDVTTSNLDEGATLQDVSSPYTSTTGGRVCFRYVDGVLTETPLWPWPMNQRIIDAMTTAGYTPVDVTATVESLLGTIPDACRDDVTEPPPVAATAGLRGTLVGSFP